jgi:hypothetical protein
MFMFLYCSLYLQHLICAYNKFSATSRKAEGYIPNEVI